MNGDHELLRILDRARIELVYTRASLHTYISEGEPLTSEIGVMISRCNDSISQADELITRVRERIAAEKAPKLVGKK